jgi:phosphoglycerate dehydrogenase-like enzyme
MVRQQQERNFEAFDVRMLSGKTLGIVGYGSIGRACAWRAKAMGMRVLAVRRRPELSEGDANVDATYSPDRRREMLAECDYVAVAGALTPETRGMIGAAEFAAMKREAVLINVGRGPVVVESALVEALGSGAIRGAALDVFDTEPLPQDHPFWGMENVLLSPHCADHNETWLDDAMECFLDNFQRFRDGAPLANVVDKRAGY